MVRQNSTSVAALAGASLSGGPGAGGGTLIGFGGVGEELARQAKGLRITQIAAGENIMAALTADGRVLTAAQHYKDERFEGQAQKTKSELDAAVKDKHIAALCTGYFSPGALTQEGHAVGPYNWAHCNEMAGQEKIVNAIQGNGGFWVLTESGRFLTTSGLKTVSYPLPEGEKGASLWPTEPCAVITDKGTLVTTYDKQGLEKLV
ncbi:hypothetical protein ACWEV4_35535, partial [Streptomyces sp. NPDC003860]